MFLKLYENIFFISDCDGMNENFFFIIHFSLFVQKESPGQKIFYCLSVRKNWEVVLLLTSVTATIVLPLQAVCVVPNCWAMLTMLSMRARCASMVTLRSMLPVRAGARSSANGQRSLRRNPSGAWRTTERKVHRRDSAPARKGISCSQILIIIIKITIKKCSLTC